MTLSEDMPDCAVLVAIDVAKHRNEVLIEMPGRARRRRLTVLNTRPIVQPQHTSLRLLMGHTKALPAPDSSDTLVVDVPPIPAEQRCDPAVSVATIFGGSLDDRRGERIFIIEPLSLSPLGRLVLANHLARTTFRHPKLCTRMLDKLMLAGGPYQ